MKKRKSEYTEGPDGNQETGRPLTATCPGLYILKGHKPVPAKSVFEWAEFLRDSMLRRVAEAG